MNIVLTCYNRLEVLVRSLDSLLKTEFQRPTNLYIFDDASDLENLLLYRKLPKKLGNLSITVFQNDIRLGCDPNVSRAIRYGFSVSNDNFLVVLDSDGIYNRNWYNFLSARVEEEKSNGVAAISIYNSERFLPLREYNQFLNEKDSFGGFALAINREVFFKSKEKIKQWDWGFVMAARKLGYKLLCSKVSYVKHIGEIGEHSEPKTYDKCNDFIGE